MAKEAFRYLELNAHKLETSKFLIEVVQNVRHFVTETAFKKI